MCSRPPTRIRGLVRGAKVEEEENRLIATTDDLVRVVKFKQWKDGLCKVSQS